MDIKSIGTIVATGGIGAVAALGLSLAGILPAVNAEENSTVSAAEALMSPARTLFPQPFDVDGLVRWNFEVDPGVSLEPIRQSAVKKISFGRVKHVNIVETDTGVYSSDAIVDPHVKYPGITVTPRRQAQIVLQWNGYGWLTLSPVGAGSFVTVVPFEGGQLVVTDDSACSYTASNVVC
jgi:hypothetical protein